MIQGRCVARLRMVYPACHKVPYMEAFVAFVAGACPYCYPVTIYSECETKDNLFITGIFIVVEDINCGNDNELNAISGVHKTSHRTN